MDRVQQKSNVPSQDVPKLRTRGKNAYVMVEAANVIRVVVAEVQERRELLAKESLLRLSLSVPFEPDEHIRRDEAPFTWQLHPPPQWKSAQSRSPPWPQGS
ncbi:hypothetical protein Ae201684_015102 [Aphanomyces euteiches]|uniref:Uncharacterized protein n=1 Tax=Aphanomyces euteiches TaxID=100861 RepID=A0A6G0WHQ7_9STRA|nr:hypothetical protein Ae201684_015102 [Aphanomyces euteiches]